MTRSGKLSKRDMATVERALELLSAWSEKAEEDDREDEYLYEVAMNAVCGLAEFVRNYEGV